MWRPFALALFCLLTTGCIEPAVVFVPVTVNGVIEAELETFVYRPRGAGPFPVALLSHGSSGGEPGRSFPWRDEAAFLASKGYVVLAPMRRGRGRSTGRSLESEDRNCDIATWEPGLRSAFGDLDAIVEYARTIPDADVSRLTLLGASRGGFLSVAYAAEGRHRASVRAVVNLVGGWVAQAEDGCPDDFNLISYRRYGAKTRTPMLWLYGGADRYYGDEAVMDYVEAFRKAGGNVRFRLVREAPGGGHRLPDHPRLWVQDLEAFLASSTLGQ